MKVKVIVKLPNGCKYEEIVDVEDYPEPTDDDISVYVDEIIQPKIKINWEKIEDKKLWMPDA